MISYQDYVNFGGGGKKIDSGQTRSDDQSLNMINSDNQDRSLLMRGLPFKVEMSDIQTFFGGVLSEHEIFIEQKNGRRTGSALVIFENDQIA